MVLQYISKVHIFVEFLHKNQISYVYLLQEQDFYSQFKRLQKNKQIKKSTSHAVLVHDFFISMQQKYLSSRNYLRAITLS